MKWENTQKRQQRAINILLFNSSILSAQYINGTNIKSFHRSLLQLQMQVIKITAPLPPVLRTRGEEEELTEAEAEAGEVDLGSGDGFRLISDTSAHT